MNDQLASSIHLRYHDLGLVAAPTIKWLRTPLNSVFLTELSKFKQHVRAHYAARILLVFDISIKGILYVGNAPEFMPKNICHIVLTVRNKSIERTIYNSMESNIMSTYYTYLK